MSSKLQKRKTNTLQFY